MASRGIRTTGLVNRGADYGGVLNAPTPSAYVHDKYGRDFNISKPAGEYVSSLEVDAGLRMSKNPRTAYSQLSHHEIKAVGVEVSEPGVGAALARDNSGPAEPVHVGKADGKDSLTNPANRATVERLERALRKPVAQKVAEMGAAAHRAWRGMIQAGGAPSSFLAQFKPSVKVMVNREQNELTGANVPVAANAFPFSATARRLSENGLDTTPTIKVNKNKSAAVAGGAHRSALKKNFRELVGTVAFAGLEPAEAASLGAELTDALLKFFHSHLGKSHANTKRGEVTHAMMLHEGRRSNERRAPADGLDATGCHTKYALPDASLSGTLDNITGARLQARRHVGKQGVWNSCVPEGPYNPALNKFRLGQGAGQAFWDAPERRDAFAVGQAVYDRIPEDQAQLYAPGGDMSGPRRAGRFRKQGAKLAAAAAGGRRRGNTLAFGPW